MKKGIIAIIIGVGIAIGIIITIIALMNQEIVSSNQAVDDNLKIKVTFFPLYEFTNSIVKDKGIVEMLLPAGVEVHDWEPTAKDIENLKDYDMLIYNNDILEPYVKDLKESINIRFVATYYTTNQDPHVWLDPLLAKEQVNNIMNAMISIDPNNEAYYRDNAKAYIARLDALHEEISKGLENCERREFIVLHAAYGYLADRYDLKQISILGLEPEEDIPASKIKEIIDLARMNNLDVIYAEQGIDRRVIDIIAQEIDGRVLVLDPIEVVDDPSTTSYIDKMRENLDNLRIGLRCK